MKKSVSLILCCTILFILSACQSDNQEKRLVSNWEPTAIGERPLQATPTPPVSASQDIPTRQPTPTPVTEFIIPTMIPTEVPAGIYVRELDGFTIKYPSLWDIDAESDSITITDPDLNLFIVVSSNFIDEENSYETLIADFITDDKSEEADESKILVEEELTHPTADVAKLAILEGDLFGEPIHVYLAYLEKEARAVTFVALGQKQNIEARRKTLDTMVAQIEAGGDRLLGYDRDETLVLQGGDPIPEGLDPAQQTGSAAGYVGLLYSGLVQLNSSLQVVPDLAESWEVSDDGTVYTFHLRDGLTFADGRPLTAADVQYSWERAADPATDSSTVDTYMGDILGLQEKLNGEADSISGVQIIDDQTLEVTLDGPKPYFLAKLTYPVSYVLDQENVVGEDLEDWVYEPNPSGPFTMAAYEENEYYVFESNEAFYAPPELARVIYLLSRVGNATSLFEAGEVDVTYLGGVDSIEVRRPSHELHDNWVTTTSLCTTLLQFNNTLAPMDDPLVREAFALAVDREGLNELISEGTNLVASTILPPGMPGYDASLATAQTENTYNVEAAQAALAASSYADNLPTIVISVGGFGDSERDDLNAIAETWRDVLDADVVIEFLDPIEFKEIIDDERGHVVSYGWCADYPDPENFLDVLYHSDSIFNVGGYTNPEVDELLEAARVELDVSTRLALYAEIEQQLLNDWAAIPLTHGVSDALVNERIEGFVLSPMGTKIIPWLSLTTAGEE